MVGCGRVSPRYMAGIARDPALSLVACTDLDPERAEALASEYGVPTTASLDELLADECVEVILNLTPPDQHLDVCKAALLAGKHVYSEKPLTNTRNETTEVLELAKRQGLRVACAPDQVLGWTLTTARGLVDEGAIGRPFAATAFVMTHGHESWHPDPRAYYASVGGGPFFNRAPYYLSALLWMFNSPVEAVSALGGTTFPSRVISTGPLAGTEFPVETETHINAHVRFESGAMASIVTSFDVWGTVLPRIEVYGTKGTLVLPDPTHYSEPLRLLREDGSDETIEDASGDGEVYGSGLRDLGRALRSGEDHRLGPELAYHLVDAIEAVHDSMRASAWKPVQSGIGDIRG